MGSKKTRRNSAFLVADRQSVARLVISQECSPVITLLCSNTAGCSYGFGSFGILFSQATCRNGHDESALITKQELLLRMTTSAQDGKTRCWRPTHVTYAVNINSLGRRDNDVKWCSPTNQPLPYQTLETRYRPCKLSNLPCTSSNAALYARTFSWYDVTTPSRVVPSSSFRQHHGGFAPKIRDGR
jgi:hypothetical protein